MNTRTTSENCAFSFFSTALVAALLLCGIAAPAQAVSKGVLSDPDSTTDMPFVLLQIQADVQGSLSDLDWRVAKASYDLSSTGLQGAAADGVLRLLLDTNSNLIEAVTVSDEGKIVAAECKGCEGAVGADISNQEHIARILKEKIPAFSKEFMLVEGFNGTALAYPVFSPQGQLLGGISTIIESDKLLGDIAASRLHFDIYNRGNITDYSFWAMQLDGLIIYDRDASQIGKNLFEDPLYRPFPSLLALGHRMAAERSGHGSYSFQVTEGNESVVTKEVYWTTAGLHGREWRLAVARIVK
jgi:polar amino acid transport system substrate-binding protein